MNVGESASFGMESTRKPARTVSGGVSRSRMLRKVAKMKVLSIDLGGTHIGCAVVEQTDVLAYKSISSDNARSLATVLPEIEQTLRDLLLEASVKSSKCAGIVMGFPGIVDTNTGVILSTLKKYGDAPRLNLAAKYRQSFDLPFRIENDARMALLGEHYAGAAQGCGNVVMMILGTGIGTAAMIKGQVLRGAHAQAGILGGHLPLKPDGRQCVCGNLGCAESEASGWSLPLVAKAWIGFSSSSLAGGRKIDFGYLFAEASKGDTVAQAIRDHCLQVWAMNAVALIHAYDPEVVVVAGGVLRSNREQTISFIQEYVAKHAWTSWGKVAVRATQCGVQAVLLGAIPLIRERRSV
jgi:glucokinase